MESINYEKSQYLFSRKWEELIEDEKEISNFIGDLNNKYEDNNLYFKLITDDNAPEINEEEIKKVPNISNAYWKKTWRLYIRRI